MRSETLTVRRGLIEDCSEILALQRDNLRSAERSRDAAGFLSVASTLDELRAVVSRDGLFVATRGSRLVAYFGLMSLGSETSVRYLSAVLETALFDGRRLTELRVGLGPQVCVAQSARRTGVSSAVSIHAMHALSSRFDCLLGSVHRDNVAGYHFNVRRLGARVVHADSERRFLVYDLRRSSAPEPHVR